MDSEYFAAGAAVLLISVLLLLTQKPAPILDKREFRQFKLIKKTIISPNTAIYRFQLPTGRGLELPIGQHISVRAIIDGKEVVRSYTPTSLSTDLGYFELLIKSYPTGQLSKWFGELELGAMVDVRGPKGNFLYRPNMCRSIGMIAGGTGLTPMLQVIKCIQALPIDFMCNN
jgi:cytochrome-b5 reductase